MTKVHKKINAGKRKLYSLKEIRLKYKYDERMHYEQQQLKENFFNYVY